MRTPRLGAAIGLMVGIAVLGSAGLPGSAVAGSICGTVIDAETSAPVAHAGIFVRTTAGAYTGIYAASDDQGAYCVDDVPAGIYDLEIRHDDYALRYVLGVIVSDPVTDVSVTLDAGPVALRAPWPNPARGPITFAYRAPSASRIAVYDASGRFVHGWSAVAAPTWREISWNGRDRFGRALAAGSYWLRLETSNGSVRQRFVILH